MGNNHGEKTKKIFAIFRAIWTHHFGGRCSHILNSTIVWLAVNGTQSSAAKEKKNRKDFIACVG